MNSTTTTQKVRITALHTIQRRFAVVFMGVKVAVAFSRDSGAKVGYDAIMLEGRITSGGSRVNWFCQVDSGSVFELEVDREFFIKNHNRIQNWNIVTIEEFTTTKARNSALIAMEKNLE